MRKIVKGLNGNNKGRRAEYRAVCRKYGAENVRRVDNPNLSMSWKPENGMNVHCEGGICDGYVLAVTFITDKIVMCSQNGKLRQEYRWSGSSHYDDTKIFRPESEPWETSIANAEHEPRRGAP